MQTSTNAPRGRLAPSPTGAQHLGNARTYLIAWLAARSAHGEVVLRIEDIDSPRVKVGAAEQAIEDLRWLGLDWDEGPDVGGPHGPYVQTERTSLYQSALEQLIAQNRVYPCTCSRTDVAAAASAPHVGQEGPRYPGTCSHWQLGDALPDAGTYCWRFRADDYDDQFFDAASGDVVCNVARDLGDFPITRKQGEIAYQLAVVVDDAAMEVNQIVRGDDLIASAFRQRQLQRVLGYPLIKQCHLPLVIGEDGRRLAKRHGDTRLATYRNQGVKPERIIGLLAWSAGLLPQPQDITSSELVSGFTLTNLPREPFVLTARHEAYLVGAG